MITLKQFTGQNITPTDDATLYELFSSSQAGIIYGCNVTSLGANQLQVSAGRGLILGRSFVVEQETILAELAPSGNMKGRLSIKIDLGNAETPISFETQVGSVLPSPTQEQLNRGGAVYEMPLAEYDVDAIQISNVTMVAENVYMASPWGDENANASESDNGVDIVSRLKGSKVVRFIAPKDQTGEDSYTLDGQTVQLQDYQGNALDGAWKSGAPVQLLIEAGKAFFPAGGGGGTAMTVGTYTGDGTDERTITIGFAPKNVVVFGANMNAPLVSAAGTISNVRFAIGVTDAGGTFRASDGLSIENNGFTVMSLPPAAMPPNASRVQLNLNGSLYAYIIW